MARSVSSSVERTTSGPSLIGTTLPGALPPDDEPCFLLTRTSTAGTTPPHNQPGRRQGDRSYGDGRRRVDGPARPRHGGSAGRSRCGPFGDAPLQGNNSATESRYIQ